MVRTLTLFPTLAAGRDTLNQAPSECGRRPELSGVHARVADAAGGGRDNPDSFSGKIGSRTNSEKVSDGVGSESSPYGSSDLMRPRVPFFSRSTS